MENKREKKESVKEFLLRWSKGTRASPQVQFPSVALLIPALCCIVLTRGICFRQRSLAASQIFLQPLKAIPKDILCIFKTHLEINRFSLRKQIKIQRPPLSRDLSRSVLWMVLNPSMLVIMPSFVIRACAPWPQDPSSFSFLWLLWLLLFPPVYSLTWA